MVRCAEEDEQEAGEEGHPSGDTGSQGCRGKGSEVAWMLPRASESDELEDHDQGAGCGFGQAEAGDHLSLGEPAVGFHRLLGDIREHGVGAAEGDESGLTEKEAFLDSDRGSDCS